MRYTLSILSLVLLTTYCAGYSGTRVIRSLAKVGKAAVKKLLKDCSTLQYDPRVPPLYSKTGGYRQALKDFKSVKPKNVKQNTIRLESGDVAVTGRIGNRVIQLIKGSGDRKTMLNIFRLPDQTKDWANDHIGIIYDD